MGYFETEKKLDEAVVSVLCEEAAVSYDSALGKIETLSFGRGILRIYRDVRRIEFKEHGGSYDGRVWGIPLDLVRYYTYQPKCRSEDF